MKIRFEKIISIVLIVAMLMAVGMPAFAETSYEKDHFSQEQTQIEIWETIPLSEIPSEVISSPQNLEKYLQKIFSDNTESTVELSNYNNSVYALNNSAKSIIEFFSVSIPNITDTTLTLVVTNISDDYVTTNNIKVVVSGTNNSATHTIAKLNWPPGITRVNITSYQQSCVEQIEINLKVLESGMYNVVEPVLGQRGLGLSHIGKWAPGSFSSSQKSLDYHYDRHKGDTYIQPILTIEDYCISAENFLEYCNNNNISGTYNAGSTANAYKYQVNGKYIIAVGSANKVTGPIVSYGGN